MGCFGASLANGAEYTGDYGRATVRYLADWHWPRIQARGPRHPRERSPSDGGRKRVRGTIERAMRHFTLEAPHFDTFWFLFAHAFH